MFSDQSSNTMHKTAGPDFQVSLTRQRGITAIIVLLSGIAAIVVIALIAFNVSDYNRRHVSLQGEEENALVVLSPQVTLYPTVDSEVPPLHPDILWKESRIISDLLFINMEGGTVELEGYYVESEILAGCPSGFLDYYKNELSGRGWYRTDLAGGPGNEWHSFQKGEQYFSFGMRNVSEGCQTVVMFN